MIPMHTGKRSWPVMLAMTLISVTIFGGDMQQSQLITQDELTGLPEPVRRALNYSQIVGTPRISEVHLKQKGRFKTAPDKPWVPFTAVQTFQIDEPGFEWKVKMKMAPFVWVRGTDKLTDGRGSMKIKLLGLIPVVNARSPEMDQGAMTRFLSESVWFPQAWLNEHISWESIDASAAKATLTIGDKAVSGTFHFDEAGRVTEFRCERYYASGKNMLLLPWRTPIDHYSEVNGVRLGTRGRAIWDLAEGEYCYVDLEIIEYETSGQSK